LCWSTKAATLEHVKIEEKLLFRVYRNSPTLFRMVPSPTGRPPMAYSQCPSEQEPIKNFGESERGHIQGQGTPSYLRIGKAMNFKFG